MTLNALEIIAFGLVGIALVIGLLRLVLGPGAADRIVAADTLSVTATAGIAGFAVFFATPLYLDVALVFGVLAFVFVVAIARTIEANWDAPGRTTDTEAERP
ncbi:monovalent cation/H+ antiporter complex subunit F [uncultured Thiohalocapsa sp.]|uniref:monovalent cation/H+ antiporter complex subunit F n=1 Tax=uncultured Thiohalocapsa sp. TaxID=768990 RepID=UPI0025E2B4AD|nr:monovalent cation/H+ antiporter complex subunit F [uncultured Thiohalocapsa sp.]